MSPAGLTEGVGPAPAPATIPARNTSFSMLNPNQQLAVDSTSLGEFKKCPRSYYYSIVLGYQPRQTSVHLEFGIWFHGGCERYDHARAGGADHQEALRVAVRWLMQETWNKTLRRPWYSDHPSKNRLTLIRSVVWYLEEFGAEDNLHTVLLASGKPAVEVSFAFAANRETRAGEPQLLCGHIDRVVEFNGELYISDRKTTGGALGPSFFQQFSPSNQMSLYATAGHVALDIPVRGIIIDGVQVGATFSRFQRGLSPRTRDQLDEWLAGVDWWLGEMEACATRGQWTMNDKSCDMYGGCQFRGVCSRAPGAREAWLKTDFQRRTWDPLQRRGDV